MRSAALLILLLTAAVALAEEPVTHVNVVVTDGKGKPVRGLTAADFEAVDAKSQPVAIASVTEGSATAPRRIAVFMDNASLPLAQRRQAVAALRTWLDASVRPDRDQVAIAASNLGFRTLLEWSADKAGIAAALESASRDAGGHVEQERRRAERIINDVLTRAGQTQANDPIKPTFDEIMQAGRVYAASQRRDTDSLISSLAAVLDWFTTAAGRNVLVVVGEGLPRNPGADMFEYINTLKMQVETTGPEILAPTARRASPLTESRGYDVEGSLRQIRATARKRGIAIYAINSGRSESGSGSIESLRPSDVNSEFARSVGGMAGYDYLATATGGVAFIGMPADRALSQIASDLDGGYDLTYAGAGEATIRAKGALRVRSTAGGEPPGPDDRMREAVLANRGTAPASNDLGIRLATEPARVEGTDRIVPLRVLIPISSLRIEPVGAEVTGGFAVYIAANNGTSSTKVVKKTHEFRWPADALTYGQGKNMTFAIDVPVPAGFDAISVGVLDQRSQKSGFDRVQIAHD